MKSIPIIFCIDVEPDDFTPHPYQPIPWRGFEACVKRQQSIRDLFESATGRGVNFSWFVRADPQIQQVYGEAGWAFTYYGQFLQGLVALGDEIGLHVHAARLDEEAGRWIEDFGSQEWVSECVTTAFGAYLAAFGAPCRSVRFGNHFMNESTSNLIERLGARFDLTPEPGARRRTQLGGRLVMTGELPDYTNLRRMPHRRVQKSLEQLDDKSNSLWVVPVSTVMLDGDAPDEARIASDDKVYLRLGLWYPPVAFAYVFDSCLRAFDAPHLSLVMRSDMPLAPLLDSSIQQNIRWIAGHPLARQFVICRPDEAVKVVSAM